MFDRGQEGEGKSGLLERAENRGRLRRSWSNRKLCGPGKALAFSCLVTAFVRILVRSINSFCPS